MKSLEDELAPTGLEPYRAETWIVHEHNMQLRPCECGKSVRADRRDPTHGVRSHQQTREHKAWRDANGL